MASPLPPDAGSQPPTTKTEKDHEEAEVEEEEESLQTALAAAAVRVKRLEDGDEEFPGKKADEAVEVLTKLCDKIAELNILPGRGNSATCADDLGDGDLRCLLAPYYLARALQHARCDPPGPASRLRHVRKTEKACRYFLRVATSLDDLVTDDEKKDWEELEAEADPETRREQSGRRLPNASALRQAHVARHSRRDKTLNKLKALDARIKEDAASREDEFARERSLLEILLAAQTTLQDARFLKREREMLEAISKNAKFFPDGDLDNPQRPDTQDEDDDEDDAEDARAPYRGPRALNIPGMPDDEMKWLAQGADGSGLRVLKIDATPDHGYAIQFRRERVRAGVFEPDKRRFPSQSLDVAIDKEIQETLEREERQRNFKKDPANDQRRTKELERDGDEDDEHTYDAATKRDEDWDTWKEHHPRGAGNKGHHIY